MRRLFRKPFLGIIFTMILLSQFNIGCLAALSSNFGSYLKPYAANSPWNSKPEGVTFGDYTIPTSTYYPMVGQGAYSVQAFQALPTDPPVTVYPLVGKSGIWDPDSEMNVKSVSIFHWPAGVAAAAGTDGHADIIDEAQGVVHSFWQLKNVNGQWQAALYAWSPLDGRGFGDPAHYYQGARAAGVPTSAGIIRQHEINDGNPLYYHALAMSLTYNGLSAKSPLQFPATSADLTAATTNSGEIPEGALLMLPETFDISAIKTPQLRKVANTLMMYGAYVVDRNNGTPFAIYVENGPIKYSYANPDGSWNNQAAVDLQTIRAGLRQVTNVTRWIDGNNLFFHPNWGLNILSLRGQWILDPKNSAGSVAGGFDTLKQAVVFGKTTTPVIQYQRSTVMTNVPWGQPKSGETFILSVHTVNGGRFRLRISDKTSNQVLYDSNDLVNGQVVQFVWPTDNYVYTKLIVSGIARSSSVKAILVKKFW